MARQSDPRAFDAPHPFGIGIGLALGTRPPARGALWVIAFCVLGTLLAPIVRAGFDEHLFVVATDFTTSGSASKMALDEPFTTDIDVESVGADPVVRAHGGLVYVVNRFGNDAVQIIDAATCQTVRAFSVGPGSNPQDIAIVDATRAYVSRFGSRWLYLVNPATGAVADSVDLGGFADADGLPEMSYMALYGDHLFVQLQRLDQDGFFDPVPPSYLAVVDVTTNTLVDVEPGTTGVQAITLTGTNPHQKMQLDAGAGRLYVSEIGVFGAQDGGVELVDVNALDALGMVLSETTTGGDVSTAVIVSATQGYVLTSDDFFFTTRLVRFDPSTGAVTGTLFTTSSFTSALALDRETGRLYLADRETTAPGVRVFDSATDMQITTGPVSVGLPPVDMAIVRPVPVDVVQSPTPWAAHLGAMPNPFAVRTELSLFAPQAEGTAIAVDVFDARGRHVRTLDAHAVHGMVRAHWDGTDASGRRVAAGTYLYRTRGAGSVRHEEAGTGRVVLVR